MNIADLIVIAALLLGIGIGVRKGAIRMVLSLFSSLAAIIVAFFIQPLLLPLLKQYTGIYDTLLNLILHNVDLTALAQKLVRPAETPESVKFSPQIMEVLGKKLGTSKLLGDMQIQLGQNLAEIAMQIVSFFIGLVLVWIAFGLLSRLLTGIGRLPFIRQLNKAVGGVVGGLFSVLMLWLGMLFLNYWFSTGQHLEILLLIQQSALAKYVYQYNFLVYYLLLLQ